MFVTGLWEEHGCGKNIAVLPAHRGLDFDLGQILLMDLALRAASHPLALGESGEACGRARGPSLGECWDPSNQHLLLGGWQENRLCCPALLLEGLAWAGGLVSLLME